MPSVVKQGTLKVNTNVASGNNGGTTQRRRGSVTTPDLQAHLQKLQTVSVVTSKIFALLGEQLTSVSATIPISRGHESLNDLRARTKAHRDGLKTAFDPLREQIEQAKANFWAKNGGRLEDIIREYVQQKIKDRVRVEVNKQLRHYVAYVKDRETNNMGLKQASDISHARLQNSLLRINYPEEPVTWIGNLPSEAGQEITLKGLVDAQGDFMKKLARSLGISPAEEDDPIDTLNKMMRYLGIAYKGLPSRGSILLMPTKANL